MSHRIASLFASLAIALLVVALFDPQASAATICVPDQFETQLVFGKNALARYLRTGSGNAFWAYDYADEVERIDYLSKINRRPYWPDDKGMTTTVLTFFYDRIEYIWQTTAQGDVINCHFGDTFRLNPAAGPMNRLCVDTTGSTATIGGAQVQYWKGTLAGYNSFGGMFSLRDEYRSFPVEGLSSPNSGLPLIMSVNQRKRGRHVQALFLNTTLGIKNPNIFEIPATCPAP